MHDYYQMGDGEFNLARMERDTIIKAFNLYPNETQVKISSRLGISVRALIYKMKKYSIQMRAKVV